MSEFNMSGLFSMKSEDKNHSISVGAWGGKMQFSIFTGVGGSKPVSIPISMEMYVLIVNILREVKKGVPNSAHPLRILAWNNELRKREIKQVLLFGIDGNGKYFIEFKDVTTGMTVKFPFIGTRNVETGVEADSDTARSRLFFESFLVSFEQLPMAAMFTRSNMPKFSGSNNPSTNTNYNRNTGGNANYQQYTNQVQSPSAPAVAPSDNNMSTEDIY